MPLIHSRFHDSVPILSQTYHIICETQWKMEIQASLYKNYKEFQSGDSRALNQGEVLLSARSSANTEVTHPWSRLYSLSVWRDRLSWDLSKSDVSLCCRKSEMQSQKICGGQCVYVSVFGGMNRHYFPWKVRANITQLWESQTPKLSLLLHV